MFFSRPRFLFILSILAVAAVYAVAADQPPAPKEPAQKSAPAAAPQAAPASGVVVFIDPATGKIRQPDASEIGALIPSTESVAPKAPEPALLQGPGGAVGARLGADSLTYMVVTTAPDGKLAMDCVTGDHAAAARVTAGPASTAAKTAPTATSPASKAKETSAGPARAQDTHDVRIPR
jgi:cytoskeletal protein RodZ